MAESLVKSLRIDPETWARVEAYAAAQNWSANKAVTVLIEDGLPTEADKPAIVRGKKAAAKLRPAKHKIPVGNQRGPLQKGAKIADERPPGRVDVLGMLDE
jgi:hypothetical protein